MTGLKRNPFFYSSSMLCREAHFASVLLISSGPPEAAVAAFTKGVGESCNSQARRFPFGSELLGSERQI
jgi:hypothetical protein